MNENNKKEAPASQQGQGGASVWAGKIRPFLKKNAKWLIPAACVLAVLVLFWALKRSPEQQVTADPEYVQDAPQVQDVSNSLSGVGTLKPAQTYTVTSLVTARSWRLILRKAMWWRRARFCIQWTVPMLPPM